MIMLMTMTIPDGHDHDHDDSDDDHDDHDHYHGGDDRDYGLGSVPRLFGSTGQKKGVTGESITLTVIMLNWQLLARSLRLKP